MFILQPFDHSDKAYVTIVGIWNNVWPDRATTVTQMQEYDQRRDPQHFFERWVVHDQSGVAVGFGILFALWWSAEPDQYVIDFTTIPEKRGKGAATQFYKHGLATLTRRGYQKLVAQTREDVVAGINFLEHRGFARKLRKLESVLTLDNYEPQQMAEAAPHMAAQGIDIVPLPMLQKRDPDWRQKLWELDWLIIQDVPSFTQRTRPTLEEFAQRFQQSDFLPNGLVVAIDMRNGDYVGMSQVYQSKAAAQQLETGLTGVLRQYRRRGIATAMKRQIIDFALHSGVTAIRTRNAEHNPMYQINQKLGFTPLPSWLTYEKIVDSTTG